MPKKLTISRMENGQAFLDELIFTKRLGDGDNCPLHLSDLPGDLLPTDKIYINYDEGFYSEDNSWDAFTEVYVIRERPETADECEKRLEEARKYKEDMRERRYQNYLKLKEEFEKGDDLQIDPEKVIVVDPVMIKENRSEQAKSCHAEQDGIYFHAACASQPSCEDCAAYR